MSSHNQLEFYQRGISDKFHYSFTGMCFASLALSAQFPPAMGTCCRILLIISWILLLLAGIFGGYRLSIQPGFYQVNLGREMAKDNLVNARAHRNKNGEETAIEQINTAEIILEKKSKIFPKLYKAQCLLFLFGMLSNLIFISINVLQ